MTISSVGIFKVEVARVVNDRAVNERNHPMAGHRPARKRRFFTHRQIRMRVTRQRGCCVQASCPISRADSP
jgi:hypothetical protein